MIYDLLDMIAANHSYVYAEVYEVFEQLNSIDAVLVAIEMASINEMSLREATQYMCQNRALCQPASTS